MHPSANSFNRGNFRNSPANSLEGNPGLIRTSFVTSRNPNHSRSGQSANRATQHRIKPRVSLASSPERGKFRHYHTFRNSTGSVRRQHRPRLQYVGMRNGHRVFKRIRRPATAFSTTNSTSSGRPDHIKPLSQSSFNGSSRQDSSPRKTLWLRSQDGRRFIKVGLRPTAQANAYDNRERSSDQKPTQPFSGRFKRRGNRTKLKHGKSGSRRKRIRLLRSSRKLTKTKDSELNISSQDNRRRTIQARRDFIRRRLNLHKGRKLTLSNRQHQSMFQTLLQKLTRDAWKYSYKTGGNETADITEEIKVSSNNESDIDSGIRSSLSEEEYNIFHNDSLSDAEKYLALMRLNFIEELEESTVPVLELYPYNEQDVNDESNDIIFKTVLIDFVDTDFVSLVDPKELDWMHPSFNVSLLSEGTEWEFEEYQTNDQTNDSNSERDIVKNIDFSNKSIEESFETHKNASALKDIKDMIHNDKNFDDLHSNVSNTDQNLDEEIEMKRTTEENDLIFHILDYTDEYDNNGNNMNKENTTDYSSLYHSPAVETSTSFSSNDSTSHPVPTSTPSIPETGFATGKLIDTLNIATVKSEQRTKDEVPVPSETFDMETTIDLNSEENLSSHFETNQSKSQEELYNNVNRKVDDSEREIVRSDFENLDIMQTKKADDNGRGFLPSGCSTENTSPDCDHLLENSPQDENQESLDTSKYTDAYAPEMELLDGVDWKNSTALEETLSNLSKSPQSKSSLNKMPLPLVTLMVSLNMIL